MTDPLATGSVFVRVSVERRIALSLITKWWTVEENKALLDGDQEARDNLISEAQRIALQQPDDVDLDVAQIWMDGRDIDALSRESS